LTQAQAAVNAVEESLADAILEPDIGRATGTADVLGRRCAGDSARFSVTDF
jgi:hypothetical protein